MAIKLEPTPEFKQCVKIFDKLLSLGKDCPFCEWFWAEKEMDYNVLKAHLFLDHKDGSSEIDDSLLSEMR